MFWMNDFFQKEFSFQFFNAKSSLTDNCLRTNRFHGPTVMWIMLNEFEPSTFGVIFFVSWIFCKFFIYFEIAQF